MQRRILILVAFLAAMVLFVGCEKEVLDPIVKKDPPVVEPIAKFTVEITSVGDGGTVTPLGIKEVNKGGSLSLTISAKPGYKKSLKVNGTEVSLTGDTYALSNIANDYKLDVSFEKTLSWYFMQGKWKKDSIYIKEANGSWSGYQMWGKAGEEQSYVTYLPTGRMVIFDAVKDKVVGDGPWSVNETTKPATLNSSGEILEIESISPDGKRIVLAKYDIPNIDPKITDKGSGRVVYTILKE